jgi:hypothetical protein
MKKILIYFIVLLITTSCSEAKKFRRAEKKIYRLTQKYPDLLKKDTLHDTFSIVTPEVRYDTQFIDKPGDTTYINSGKLEIKYVRVGDTTYIEGKCKSDTIIQVVEIPVERIVIRKETIVDQVIRYFKSSIIWVIILLVLAFVVRILWKFIKPF